MNFLSGGRKQSLSISSVEDLKLSQRTPSSSEGISTPTIQQNRPTQADRNKKSLFRRCNVLLTMLANVPNVDHTIEKVLKIINDNDPVKIVWSLLRQGSTLCDTLNYLRPGTIENINPLPDHDYLDESFLSDKQAKENVKKYLDASKEEFFMTDEDLFSLSDLYKDDSNCLVKAMDTVEKLLKRIEETKRVDLSKKLTPEVSKRLSSASTSSRPLSFQSELGTTEELEEENTNRAKVLKEILETEVNYVDDLERLQKYSIACRDQEVLNPAEISQIFKNLDQLLDFQRRFLVAMEREYNNNQRNPDLLSLFEQHEKGFIVYDIFCPNNRVAAATLAENRPKLMKLEKIMDPLYEVNSYLIKPIQRICKYPLLIKELIKNTPQEDPNMENLKRLQAVVKVIADRVNVKQRTEETIADAREIESKIEDWRGLDLDFMQEIVLVDHLQVSMKDVEREMIVLLYENIIVLCRESSQSLRRKKEKTIVVKGHVLISNITGVVNNSTSNEFCLKVFWKSTEIETFKMRFITEDQLRLWQGELEKRVEANRLMADRAPKLLKEKAAAARKEEEDRIEVASSGSSKRASVIDFAGLSDGGSKRSSIIDFPQSYDNKGRRPSIIRPQMPPKTRTAEEENAVLKELGKLSKMIQDYIQSQEKEKETAAKSEHYFVKVHFSMIKEEIFLYSFSSIPTLHDFKLTILKKIHKITAPDSVFDEESLSGFEFLYKDEDNDMIKLKIDEDLEVAFISNKDSKIQIYLGVAESEDYDEEDGNETNNYQYNYDREEDSETDNLSDEE